MYFGFDLPRKDTCLDLEERLEKINNFLLNYAPVDDGHRHFGVFLLPPKNKGKAINFTTASSNELAKRQSKTQYMLCIEFFGKDKKFQTDLEIIYDLGETPELYDSIQAEVSAISYLCAYPTQTVTFTLSENSISILFRFMDTDPNIKRISNHLEFIVPNLANKNQ